MRNKITKKTTLKEILDLSGTEKILKKYNLPCLFCPLAAEEISYLEIGKVAEMYNINIDNLLKDLNKKTE